MYIAILQGEEVENEIDILWCCASCVMTKYGWSKDQYAFVKSIIQANKPIPVPPETNSDAEFGKYIKSIKL